MGGGAYPPWQGSFLWLALWAWIFFFLQPESQGLPSRSKRFKTLIKDPLTWVAIAFFLYLVIQYLNTGRVQVFDFDKNQWIYSPPPISWLPSSITGVEAKEMLRWFGPILTVVLILRHSWAILSTRNILWLICLNGFCNALLAFIQPAMGWDKMYNFQRFGHNFYGSFGYPNHGAVYFILLFAIALGLFLKEILSESSDRDTPTLCLSAVWALTFFIAANLSTSRAGILGAWLVLILSLGSLSIIAWPRKHPVQRVYGLITISVLVGFFAALFSFFAKPVHMQELKNATTNLNVYNEISGRFFQIESAYKLWQDHPLYGVGGWGYRYLGSHYMPKEEWVKMLGKGKANVHNDWMQFGAEFGLIGFGLLLGVFLPRMKAIFSSVFKHPENGASIWADPLRICVFYGLVMVVLDSQFDIPLRSPAVFIHTVLLLFILSPQPSSTSIWLPIIDWRNLQPAAFQLKKRTRETHTEDTSSR